MIQLSCELGMAGDGTVSQADLEVVVDEDVDPAQLGTAIATFEHGLARVLAVKLQHDEAVTARAPDTVPDDLAAVEQPPAA